ncbi:hypothetical protein Dimus_006446 [Dionaea muscipula]
MYVLRKHLFFVFIHIYRVWPCWLGFRIQINMQLLQIITKFRFQSFHPWHKPPQEASHNARGTGMEWSAADNVVDCCPEGGDDLCKIKEFLILLSSPLTLKEQKKTPNQNTEARFQETTQMTNFTQILIKKTIHCLPKYFTEIERTSEKNLHKSIN